MRCEGWGSLGISATILSRMGSMRIGSQTDRRVRKDFSNMYITGLEKAGVDCLGDASEKGRVFAPFDSIPDWSQWEGFCCQNATNAEGDEGMGKTMAKVS